MINAQWLKRISTSCSCAVELRESQLKSKDLHESSLFTLKIIYIKSYFRSFIIRPSFTFYCCCKKREKLFCKMEMLKEERKKFSISLHESKSFSCVLKLSSKAAWCRIIMKDFMTPCICSKICHLAWWMSERFRKLSLREMMTMMRRELLKAMIFEFYYWFKIFLKIFSLLTHC